MKYFLMLLVTILFTYLPFSSIADVNGEAIKIPEDLAEVQSLAFLKNCKPDLPVPDSAVDIVTDVMGVSKHHPFRVMRACIKQKIETAQSRICNAQKKTTLDDHSNAKLEQIQFQFNQTLYQLAADMNKILENRKDSDNDLERLLNWTSQSEVAALRDVLHIHVQNQNPCATQGPGQARPLHHPPLQEADTFQPDHPLLQRGPEQARVL